jgi:hypothetical protein
VAFADALAEALADASAEGFLPGFSLAFGDDFSAEAAAWVGAPSPVTASVALGEPDSGVVAVAL